MKKGLKVFLTRLLMFVIVTISAMVLGIILWNDNNTAVSFTMSISLGTIIAMMISALIKNLSEYRKTGNFFGTRNDTAVLGITGYVLSRLAWCIFLVFCILISFVDEIGDSAISVSALGLALVMGLVSVFIGISFFSRMGREKNTGSSGLSVDQFVARYGNGIGKYSSLNADSFLGSDERCHKLAAILTGGREYDGAPLVSAINDAYLFPMPDILPRDFDTLFSESSQYFVLPLNELLRKHGYPVEIRPEQWHGALKGFLTGQLTNRLHDGVNINYYLAHCAERILESEGLAIVELVFSAGGMYCGVVHLQSLTYLQQLCM